MTTTTNWMLQLVLPHDKTKKVHSVSKRSYKFKQELNIHQNEENGTTPLRSKQEILRKQPKQKDLSKPSKTGKTNLVMESTHCEVKKLM